MHYQVLIVFQEVNRQLEITITHFRSKFTVVAVDKERIHILILLIAESRIQLRVWIITGT